jgi:hypothetical protein
LEEEKKNYLPLGLFVLFLVFVGIISGFTNYKQEKLICSKLQNVCYVEKINLYNMKSSHELVKFSDIADVGHFRQKIKGNRYAKGYTEYLLRFILKDNNSVVIFAKSYYDLDELNHDVLFLKKQIKNKKENTFELVRN